MYVLMGLSSYLVWTHGGWHAQKVQHRFDASCLAQHLLGSYVHSRLHPLCTRVRVAAPLLMCAGAPQGALTLYAVQLALNAAWQPLFFNAHRMDWALADILALNVALAATIAAFHKVEPAAAVLMLPYMAWVAFATYLNYAFLKLNPPVRAAR